MNKVSLTNIGYSRLRGSSEPGGTTSRVVNMNTRLDRLRSWLDAAASVAVLIGVVLLALRVLPARRNRPEPRPVVPSEPVEMGEAWRKGRSEARVAVLEYSEFQCPFCGTFAREVLPELEKKYIASGKVVFAFRHLPLPMHRSARAAAHAAECAGANGEFWRMHDELFQDQSHLDRSRFLQIGAKIGLNRDKLESCLDGPLATRIAADEDEASRLQIGGTPTFLVGLILPDGRVRVTDRVAGSQNGLLDPIIDKLLEK